MIENWFGISSEIGVVGNEFLESVVLPHVSLAKHQNVVTTSKGIGEVGASSDDDLRVLGDGLIGRGTIIVPLGDLVKGGDRSRESSTLGAESHSSIDPNVFSNDLTLLVQVRKVVEGGLTSSVHGFHDVVEFLKL